MPIPEASVVCYKKLKKLLDKSNKRHHYSIIKKNLSEIDDESIRDDVEQLISVYNDLGMDEDKTIVFLIHGIRTQGEWQDRIRQHYDAIDDIDVYPIGYENDYFDLREFVLAPFYEENHKIRIHSEITAISDEYPLSDIAIVAHSFGTYLLSKIFKEYTGIRVNKIILCGSIIPKHFEWRNVVNLPSGSIINDVGSKDYWPLLAKVISRRFGATGTFGFKSAYINDRFHNFGHDGFFSKVFFEKYWAPFIDNGYITPSVYIRKKTPWVLSMLSKLSLLNITLFSCICVAIYLAIF